MISKVRRVVRGWRVRECELWRKVEALGRVVVVMVVFYGAEVVVFLRIKFVLELGEEDMGGDK